MFKIIAIDSDYSSIEIWYHEYYVQVFIYLLSKNTKTETRMNYTACLIH